MRFEEEKEEKRDGRGVKAKAKAKTEGGGAVRGAAAVIAIGGERQRAKTAMYQEKKMKREDRKAISKSITNSADGQISVCC